MAGAVVMAAARRARRRRAAGRQRAQRDSPVPARPAPRDIRRLILTASGGPFRELAADALAQRDRRRRAAAPDVADGAEDHDRLGDADEQGARSDRGALAVRRRRRSHRRRWSIPQSIVHSMVELVDGSVIAQLGVTDMRLPIQYAFSYPERWAAPLPPLDLPRAGRLEFEPPDTSGFPCLALAFRALRGRTGLPVVLNAANEVAVAAFLDGRLGFTGIPEYRPRDGRVRSERRDADAQAGRRAGHRRLGPRRSRPRRRAGVQLKV